MNLSHLHHPVARPNRQLQPLIISSLVIGLCAACSKPPTPTPPSAVTSNTTDAATVSNDPAPANESPEYAPAPEGKVLRHAVFFSFKEDAREEDIQGVVDAFRELPAKIEEIIDFRWGVNNSPEGLNDGFTHCFLLTFKDEAGRAAYLPHDAHKAFGDVLRPHMDKVFVVDYWGTPSEVTLEKELKHAVFFRFKEDAAPEDIAKVEEAFAALPAKIDTIKDFEWGTNNSPENHAAGFTHCFMVTFDSEEGRATYLPHPDHEAFVEILKPILDAPRVLDFWAQE
jgi:hypothetical protein